MNDVSAVPLDGDTIPDDACQYEFVFHADDGAASIDYCHNTRSRRMIYLRELDDDTQAIAVCEVHEQRQYDDLRRDYNNPLVAITVEII